MRANGQRLGWFFLMGVLGIGLSLPAQGRPSKTKKKSQLVSVPSQNRKEWVKDIEVRGNRKIEPGAILSRLVHPKNRPLEARWVRQDLESIYQLGFFKDVWVEYDPSHQKLIYHVKEKPIIREIQYQGLNSFKVDDLKDAIIVKSLDFLDESKLAEMSQRIRKFYESKGYFLASVSYRVETDSKQPEMALVTFEIQEGHKVKIRRIQIIGNQFFSESGLKAKLASSETGFLSFISGSGELKTENLEKDQQILKYLYLNEGFINVKVDGPEIRLNHDGRLVDVTFRIVEGERYLVGDIDFGGDLLIPVAQLRSLVTLKSGEYFSYDALQKDLNQLAAKYGDLGYAYVNVIPRTRLQEREKTVDILFEFEKGPLVTVGQINILGNSKTLDRVIRREIRLLEGELYNETNRRRSFENVQRLGFFDDVQFRIRSRFEEQKDFMDIDVVVKERNTGALQFGAGYGTVTGFTLQGSINQINLFGKGQRLSASINSSRIGSFFNINFTEPSWDDSDYLIGVDVSQSGLDRFEYQERRTGGAFRVGRRFDDYSFANLRYRLENVRLSPFMDANGNLLTDTNLFPLSQASGWLSSFSVSYDYDKRDDRFLPSAGQLFSFSLEYAGLGGDLYFAKMVSSYRFYHKVYKELIWRNNWTYGVVWSLFDRPVPFNERFLLGGPFSLRGYRFFRVGRVRQSAYLKNLYSSVYNLPPDQAEALSMVPTGGTQQVLWQSELELPLIKDAGIRWVVFFDLGQAEDQLSAKDFYANWGFGLRWFSPLGPLRFEWGFPLRKIVTSTDPVVFEFSIGTPF